MEENWENRKDRSIITFASYSFFLNSVWPDSSRQIYIGGLFSHGLFSHFTLPSWESFSFFTSLETERSIGEWIASLGWTLNMFGLILFFQYGTGDWESWAYTLPLCVSGENRPCAVRYRAVKAEWEAVERGKILVLIKDMMEIEI